MLAEMFANVEEGMLYDVVVNIACGPVTMRGTFDFIDTDSNTVGFCPVGKDICLSFDMDSFLSVEGADGPEGD